MSRHILYLCLDRVFSLPLPTWGLLVTSQILTMVPSPKKPFGDEVPLRLQADLSALPFHTQPPYLVCVSITAYKHPVFVLVSPARIY